MIVIAVLLSLPALAEGPYKIKRSSDPSTAHSGPPLAVVSLSPYDDLALHDGVDYYYLVRDKGNEQVPISVHKNAALEAVRVAFDDENDLAAPADPAQSTVTVSETTLPADGVTTSRVTIIPRDVDGVLLGSGLAIDVDLEALAPGFLDGPLIDLGDGSYIVDVASILAGTSLVWIRVEGLPLYDEPAVTFEYAGGPADLRELAQQELDELTAAGGSFEEALEGIDPEDPGGEKVQLAWDEALDGLAILNENDHDLDSSVVDNYLKSAIGELVSARDDPGEVDPQAILDLIDELLDIGRELAQFHIERAEDSCGPCDPEEGGELCDAEEALDTGDAERASPDPDCEEASNQYGTAVGKAVDAYGDCAG
jgi:hypothetical protein